MFELRYIDQCAIPETLKSFTRVTKKSNGSSDKSAKASPTDHTVSAIQVWFKPEMAMSVQLHFQAST